MSDEKYLDRDSEHKLRYHDELHVPVVVLVDTSGPMSGFDEDLRAVLRELSEMVLETPGLEFRLEFCVITFGGTARVTAPFMPVLSWKPPGLSCGGAAAMHGAVELALDQVETRRQQYRREGARWCAPRIYMLSRGRAEDADNGAFARLREAEKGREVLFRPVAVGADADRGFLAALTADGVVYGAEDGRSCFQCLDPLWMPDPVPEEMRPSGTDDAQFRRLIQKMDEIKELLRDF